MRELGKKDEKVVFEDVCYTYVPNIYYTIDHVIPVCIYVIHVYSCESSERT